MNTGSAYWLHKISVAAVSYTHLPILYVKGDLSLLEGRNIAVVGTRKASENGFRNIRSIARDLAGSGVTVVSGMAIGIDSAAHLGALDAKGKTVAVLGSGIDICLLYTSW